MNISRYITLIHAVGAALIAFIAAPLRQRSCLYGGSLVHMEGGEHFPEVFLPNAESRPRNQED